jgi:hypothetical protein
MPRKKAGATDDSAGDTGTNQVARRTPWQVVVVASAFYARRKVVFAPCGTVPMKSDTDSSPDRAESFSECISAKVTGEMKEEVAEAAWQRSEPGDRIAESQIVREALRDFLELDEE